MRSSVCGRPGPRGTSYPRVGAHRGGGGLGGTPPPFPHLPRYCSGLSPTLPPIPPTAHLGVGLSLGAVLNDQVPAALHPQLLVEARRHKHKRGAAVGVLYLYASA